MSKVLFTSDLHFGHARVAEIRGFNSVEDHDAVVLESLADAVRKSDTLYVLGDLVGHADDWERALDIMDAVRVQRLHLITGNHDPAHPGASRRHSDYTKQALGVFDSVAPFGAVRFAKGRRAMLSHFPYVRERAGRAPRWAEWRLRDLGQPLIHGHLHETVKRHGAEYHVGWDAWRRPVSLDELRAL